MSALPVKPPIPPEQAYLFVEEVRKRLTLVALSDDEYLATIQKASEQGLAGGRIYDALLLRCATKCQAQNIYTLNLKHFRAIAPNLAPRLRAAARPDTQRFHSPQTKGNCHPERSEGSCSEHLRANAAVLHPTPKAAARFALALFRRDTLSRYVYRWIFAKDEGRLDNARGRKAGGVSPALLARPGNRFKIQDSRFKISESRIARTDWTFEISNFRVPNPGSRIPEPRIPNPEPRIRTVNH